MVQSVTDAVSNLVFKFQISVVGYGKGEGWGSNCCYATTWSQSKNRKWWVWYGPSGTVARMLEGWRDGGAFICMSAEGDKRIGDIKDSVKKNNRETTTESQFRLEMASPKWCLSTQCAREREREREIGDWLLSAPAVEAASGYEPVNEWRPLDAVGATRRLRDARILNMARRSVHLTVIACDGHCCRHCHWRISIARHFSQSRSIGLYFLRSTCKHISTHSPLIAVA